MAYGKAPKKRGELDDVSLVEEVRKRIEQSHECDRENREEAATDLAFLAGDQWPSWVKQERSQQKRPMLTINRLPQFVRQITNDIRQAELSIKVIPEDDDQDVILARVYDELIQQIQYQSSAKHIYAMASEHQAGCGIGWFRVTTEWSSESAFDQEIRLKMIKTPLSVYCDPAAVEPDRSDAMWACVTEMIPLATFKEKYPDIGTDSIEIPGDNALSQFYWRTDDAVRVCEYWRKVPYTKTLALLETGETINITEMGEAAAGMLPIVRTREQTCYKVEHSLVCGAGVLEEPTEWPGKYIPLVPVIGGEFPLQDRTYRYGAIRFARDPQMLFNYARTAVAEAIAAQPKAPILMTPTMMGGFKTMWDNHNRTNSPYLLYNPDPEAPGGRPTREPPPNYPSALANEAQFAADDMKATTGIYDSALGAQSNETSGVAIRSRQVEADTANFHFIDNLQRSLEYAGRILIDLIPKIYDNERVVRLQGDPLKPEQSVQINKVVQTFDGQTLIINDLSAATFDVRVTIGKSYQTKRMEAANQMLELMRALPPDAQLPLAYFAVKNLDLANGDEAMRVLKNLIPPQLLADPDDPEQMQAAQPPPDPMQEAATQAELAGMQAEIEKKSADARKANAQADETELGNMLNASALGLGAPMGPMMPPKQGF